MLRCWSFATSPTRRPRLLAARKRRCLGQRSRHVGGGAGRRVQLSPRVRPDQLSLSDEPSVLHHVVIVGDGLDVLQRVAVDDVHVGDHPRLDRADLVQDAHHLRRLDRERAERLVVAQPRVRHHARGHDRAEVADADRFVGTAEHGDRPSVSADAWCKTSDAEVPPPVAGPPDRFAPLPVAARDATWFRRHQA